MTRDLAGTTLADRYDVLELVGAGGMGAVYRARDRELDDIVALKVIRAELADDPAVVARFRSEVKLARRVTHINVARTFELGRADGIVFCTMELVDGEPLARMLARGALAVSEAVAIAGALCDGLAAAHAAGVVHRDIKPDNVLIASDGRVVLADFGVAAVRVAAGDPSGTPAYMAPEQARGEPPTPAVDVYAVGVVLYEMLTGRRAFVGDVDAILAAKRSVERLALPPGSEVDGALADVVARATAREPSARLASAEALRRALVPWTRGDAPVPLPRIAVRAPDLQTVIVLAPTATPATEHELYLARAVHAELLVRLARRPKLRVLPRETAHGDAAAVVVALEVQDGLRVRVIDRVATTTLGLPLAVERIDRAVEAIAAAVGAAVAAVGVRAGDDTPLEALDLMHRARATYIQHGNTGVEHAHELLSRARALAPQDMRIAANLATVRVRLAFLTGPEAAVHLASARELARAAVTARPDLVEAQLAAGHVALHTGDPVTAAAHYRAAITCAPLDAEAHERLGLMLLEAGYLDAAIARLDEACMIEPQRHSARWEIARAWALEQRWDDHDRIVAELSKQQMDRAMTRLRFACWRGDRVMAAQAPVFSGFDAAVTAGYRSALVDGKWAEHRDQLVASARDPVANARRRTFIGQLVAEAAGFCGDVDTCNQLIAHATDEGLFDLHWMDRCPMLASARPTAAFAATRARIKQRADAILDALYGDHLVELSETTLASRH